MSATDRYNYDPFAPVYDRLAWLYSLGQISRLYAAQARKLRAGSKVLYAGAGTGQDILLAAQTGAQVSAIDVSPAMRTRARRLLQRQGCHVEYLCGDVARHARHDYYDAVVANFFLNVFPRRTMRRMLRHLTTLVRPGGRLFLGDFAYPRGNLWQRGMQYGYFLTADLFFWMFGQSALHPLYDYVAYFAEAGLELQHENHFSPGRGALPGYRGLIALRTACDNTTLQPPGFKSKIPVSRVKDQHQADEMRG